MYIYKGWIDEYRYKRLYGGRYICHRLGIQYMKLMNWVHVLLLEKLSEVVCWDASKCARGSAWPYCTCTMFFPLEEGSRQLWHHLVMSRSFCLCRGLGVYKGECAQAEGWSSGSFGSCTSKLPLEKPLTLCCGYLAVVMSLGRVVLFYGRWYLGEGLSLGKVRDATFTLTGAGTWVSKLAHLATDPLTKWEGWWVIAQTITKCQKGARGPGYPLSHLTTPQPFRFYCGDESLLEKCIKDASFDHWSPLCKPSWGREHEWWQRNLRLVLPQSPSPSPIVDSKVIEVLCWQPHQYHHNLIGQKVPNIPIMADTIGNLEATWRSICPSFKMRTWRTPSVIKIGDGIWLYTIGQGVETIPSSPTPSSHCKGILESSCGAPGWT